MKKEAVLSRTTTDQIKSKILSPEAVQIVIDVYASPNEFAELITKYYEKAFTVEFSDNI